MGQKTHPTGFRVGIIQPWASTWFAKVKEYGEFAPTRMFRGHAGSDKTAKRK